MSTFTKMFLFLVIFCLISPLDFHMYSEKVNSPNYNKLLSLEKPFRMQKLNIVWEKALKKLQPEKLKQIHHDLKYQDKEELSWKKLKAEGLDKDGLKEALIRGSFNAILEKYSLTEEFKSLKDDIKTGKVDDKYAKSEHMKAVFKDKKLNKLWLKAEQQGFSNEQLQALKEEFEHHQIKIDQYYQLMDKIHRDPSYNDDISNAVEHALEAEENYKKTWKENKSPHQSLKEKHAELKLGYDYLTSQLIPNLKNMEFDEPQVNSLWEMAKNSTFTPEELETLRGELHHFEHRLRKLKTLTNLELENEDNNFVDSSTGKRTKKIKEYNYKIEKIHKELSSRILQRHMEL